MDNFLDHWKLFAVDLMGMQQGLKHRVSHGIFPNRGFRVLELGVKNHFEISEFRSDF